MTFSCLSAHFSFFLCIFYCQYCIFPPSLFVFHFCLFLVLFSIMPNHLAVLLIFEFTPLKESKTCDIWCVLCDIYNPNFPSRLAMQLSWGQRQSSVLVSLACAACIKCLLQTFGTKRMFCSSATSCSWECLKNNLYSLSSLVWGKCWLPHKVFLCFFILQLNEE